MTIIQTGHDRKVQHRSTIFGLRKQERKYRIMNALPSTKDATIYLVMQTRATMASKPHYPPPTPTSS